MTSRDQIEVDENLRKICREIVSRGMTSAEWTSVESDDMFSEGAFEGGYDATEQEFLFSYYESDGTEYWFGFSLEIATMIAGGAKFFLDVRKAQT